MSTIQEMMETLEAHLRHVLRAESDNLHVKADACLSLCIDVANIFALVAHAGHLQDFADRPLYTKSRARVLCWLVYFEKLRRVTDTTGMVRERDLEEWIPVMDFAEWHKALRNAHGLLKRFAETGEVRLYGEEE